MKTFFMIVAIIIIGCFAMVLFMSRKTKTESQRSAHFIFVYDKSDSAGIKILEQALEDSYARISNDLKTTPANPITAFIYPNRFRYARATGNWMASGNVKGVSELHFLQTGWQESDATKIAVHEFTHAVVLQLLVDRESLTLSPDAFDAKFATFPVWLWEATSAYEAEQFSDPRNEPFLKNSSFPDFKELNNRSKGGKIYKVGYIIIEYIIQQYGKDKLVELIAGYGDVQKVLGVGQEEFLKDLYAFTKEKYLDK